MTSDELGTLIDGADKQTIVAALRDVETDERSNLAKAALKLAKKIGIELYDGSKLPGETLEQWGARRARMAAQVWCAWLATYWLGTWDDIRKLEKHDVYGPNEEQFDELVEILLPEFIRQPPEWIEEWVTFLLDRRDHFQWSWIRRLMKAGIIQRPASENYILKMPRDVAGLRADPDALQDELFCLLRTLPTDNGALIHPHDIEFADGPEGASWSLAAALRQLSAEQLVDRSRLLAASLEALQIGRRANDAIWFYRFHEFLKPTIDERAALQKVYCDLLTVDLPVVVAFALEALNELSAAGRLDPAPFLAAAERVFSLKTKGTATTVLKLLGRLAKDNPALASDVALVAVAGLSHETPDVQKGAIGVLEGLCPKTKSSEGNGAAVRWGPVTDAMAARFDLVAASLKDRVGKLIERLGGSATLPSTASPATRPVVAQTTTGAAGFAPPPSRLSPTQAVEPIRTLDELIEASSEAIESLQDAEQLERLLDGLSRFCDQRPDDFPARTAPLAKRISKLREAQTYPPYLEISVVGRVMQVIRLWLDNGTPGPRVTPGASFDIEDPPPPPVIPEEPTAEELQQSQARSSHRNALASAMRRLNGVAVLTFLEGRLEELVARLRRCDARPLLAAPTHRGGWIAATAFVERLQSLEQSGLDPQSFDLRQALLRLAPEDRDTVLGQAAGLTGSRQRAVEWALDKLQPASPADAPVYIAAEAGRDPFARLLASENPTVLEPLTFSWNVTRALPIGWNLTVMMKPDPFENPLFRFPPLTLCPIAHHASRATWTACKGASLAQVWPGNPAPFFAAGAVVIVCELETTNNDVRSLPEFLRPLLDPHAPFSDMAQLLLAAALLARSADLRGLAQDVLITVMADGRCQGTELGLTLRRLVPSGMVRCNRLAEPLAIAARASAIHMRACSDLVQTMLGDLDVPDDAHHLLTPLLEWVVELRQPIQPPLAAALSQLSGTSKTAKLARSLLKQ